MDDQPFAGEYLESRRRIEIAAGPLPIRRRAADHLIVEKKKVLDRLGYRIEGGLALPRGEPNFEDAFPARKRYRLSKLRSSCGISRGSLRPAIRAEKFSHHQHSDGTDRQQPNQTPCVERTME